MTADGSPPIVELTLGAAGWVVSAMLTLGSGAGAAACIVAVVVHPDPAPAVFGALLVAATLLFGWLTAWCFLRRLRLFTWGFQSRTVFSESLVRFEEIERIALPSVSQIGVDPVGRATFHGPAKVSLGGFPIAKSLEVGSYALARVVPRLADSIEQRLRSGESVPLGRVTLSSNGIRAAGNTVSWHEIERANFSPEGLRVFPKGRPEATLVIAQGTPNLHVVVELAARHLANPAQAIPGPSMTSSHASAPGGGERVKGFPDLDPELGALVCGRGRAGASRVVVGVLALVPAAVAVVPFDFGVRVGLLIGAGVMALIWFGMGYGGFAVYERGARGVKKRVVFAEIDHLTYHVVDQYQNGVYSGRQVGLNLESPNGKIGFNGMGAKNEGICTAVLDRLLPGLVERKWRDLESGHELRVDKLVLKRGTVSWKKEEIPIAQLQSFEPRQGFLHVWKREKEMSWAMVNLGVRDARLLVPLLERLIAGRS